MKAGYGKVISAAAAAAIGLGGTALAQDIAGQSAAETEPPFSGQANVDYAIGLWGAMAQAGLVGPGAIVTYPYEGTDPHGKMLEYLEDDFAYLGHEGLLIVKRNYAGEGDPEELEQAIFDDRMASLASVTVMFRREEGYDPDHQNWFWAKYKADGTLDTNPNGMKLAGRVAKGADQGCIACHQGAPGGDYIFTHDRLAQ